ncbi:MAG: PilX N-terminal domain-containing pilus assembly protein [Bacteroidota bacterium]
MISIRLFIRKNGRPLPAQRHMMVHPGRSHQGGTVLIMSLVILLILTILGITAMGTSSLEEKMSGNIQEGTHAFETAESGLNQAFSAAGALSLSGKTSKTFTYDNSKYRADVDTTFKQFSSPKRGSGYGNNFNAANFDQQSTGTTTSSAKAVVHQGVALIVPKSN